MSLIVVSGGRDFEDYSFVDYYLSDLHQNYAFSKIALLRKPNLGKKSVGAEELTLKWANEHDVRCQFAHKDNDRRRALEVLNLFPDMVIFFPGKWPLYTRELMRLVRLRKDSFICYRFNSDSESSRNFIEGNIYV